MALSVAGQSSWRATIVVTASGGIWNDEAWAIAAWICRTFTTPSAPTTPAIPISTSHIRLVMNGHLFSPLRTARLRAVGDRTPSGQRPGAGVPGPAAANMDIDFKMIRRQPAEDP